MEDFPSFVPVQGSSKRHSRTTSLISTDFPQNLAHRPPQRLRTPSAMSYPRASSIRSNTYVCDVVTLPSSELNDILRSAPTQNSQTLPHPSHGDISLCNDMRVSIGSALLHYPRSLLSRELYHHSHKHRLLLPSSEDDTARCTARLLSLTST